MATKKCPVFRLQLDAPTSTWFTNTGEHAVAGAREAVKAASAIARKTGHRVRITGTYGAKEMGGWCSPRTRGKPKRGAQCRFNKALKAAFKRQTRSC